MIYKRLQLLKPSVLGVMGLGLSLSTLHAHDHDHAPASVNTDIEFVENLGQWDEIAKYKANVPNGAVFVTDAGFIYNFYSKEDMKRIRDIICNHDGKPVDEAALNSIKINHHAYKVNFIGANTNITYTSKNKQRHYSNYFLGNDQSKWKGNVGHYKGVQQANIYNGIDVELYSVNNNSIKYDLVVAPGANPAQIKFSYEGVSPILKEDGSLLVKTTVNEIIEQAPYTYQIINNDTVVVPTRYTLTKNVLGFEFPNGYDRNYPLVIDPNLVFATYGGSTGQDLYAFATTYDSYGNLYAGMWSYGAGLPVTTGAFQTTHAGGTNDVAINKFNALGTQLMYSTYLGGSGGDAPHAMRVNSLGELVVMGTTQSINFPVSTGAFQATNAGGVDLFITHFNETGTQLIGSTYLGTSGSEPSMYLSTFVATTTTGGGYQTGQHLNPALELNFDNLNNIWIVTNTNSTSWPVTANSAQPSNGGGVDGVINVFNPQLSQLVYGTFLGGAGDDILQAIEIDSDGNAWVAGYTSSANFPVTSSVIGGTLNGGSDGFVTKINSGTGAIMTSTYVGTTGNQAITHLQIDRSGDIYVLGRTSVDYPATPGAYTMTGNNKIFIQKMSGDLGQILASNQVASNTSLFASAFVVDICKNVYVCVMGGNHGDLPMTQDAYQTSPGNFWFGAFDGSLSTLIFGSKFGTTSDHPHNGINRLDPSGIVYHSVCSATNTWNSLTTPANVVFPTKHPSLSGQETLAFKFNFDKAGVNSDFELDRSVNPSDSGCAPFTVKFNNGSSQAVQYEWDFGDGNTSTLPGPVHTFTNPGIYNVRLVARNDTSCVTHDTAYLTISVFEVRQPQLVLNDTILCTLENAIDIGVDILNPSVAFPGNIIQWTPTNGIIGPSDVTNITVNPTIATTYNVMVKDSVLNVCSRTSTGSVTISVFPRTLEILTNDTAICEGQTIDIKAVGSPGYDYHWSPALGVSDTNALEPTITGIQSGIYTLTASNPNCSDTTAMISIDVQKYPLVDIGAPSEICEYDTVELTSLVTPFRNDYNYAWTASSTLFNTTGASSGFIADTSTWAKLVVTSPAGCSGSDSVFVTVNKGDFGDAIASVSYCVPGSAQLWANGGTSYQWIPSYGLDDATSPTPTVSTNANTSYQVVITNDKGCTDTLETVVNAHPAAVLQLPDTVEVYPGLGYQVNPNTNAMYFAWFPPSGVSNPNISNPYLSPTVNTRYFVTATTEFGCEIVDSIDVLYKDAEIEMPNAFAPGSYNNLFKPVVKGDFNFKSFNIYNRWGKLVYESTNPNEGWDGTYNGQAQPFGVYVYYIEVENKVTGEKKVLSGNVTLVK